MDYNATTPVDKRVLEAMLPYFSEHFGNAASRTHLYGWEAEETVNIARKQIAKLLNSSVKEIVFTNGATEANNLAIKGLFSKFGNAKKHIITAETEHKAVLDVCKTLEKQGAEVTYLKPLSDGLLTIEQIENTIQPDTLLVSVMYANNEIGTIQPIAELGKLCREKGVFFHTDATQAVGKISVDVVAENIDLLSLSAHKFYGPKGVGALYVRQGIDIEPQTDGGGHERGRRSGTLNVPAIVGLGKACEIAKNEMAEEDYRLAELRNYLENSILENVTTAFVNGNKAHRMANVTNICFEGLDGEDLLLKLNQVAVSTGSACTSASVLPSHVLKALGLTNDQAYASLRFSLGRFTTKEEVDVAIKHIVEVVKTQKSN